MDKTEIKNIIVEKQKLPADVVEKFLKTKGKLKVTPEIKKIIEEIEKN